MADNAMLSLGDKYDTEIQSEPAQELNIQYSNAKFSLGQKYDPEVQSVSSNDRDVGRVIGGEVSRMLQAGVELGLNHRENVKCGLQKRKRIKSDVCGDHFKTERKRLKSWLDSPVGVVAIDDISLEPKINFLTKEKQLEPEFSSKMKIGAKVGRKYKHRGKIKNKHECAISSAIARISTNHCMGYV